MHHLVQANRARILDALSRGRRKDVTQVIGGLIDSRHPAEIAALLQSLPLEQREWAWQAVPAGHRGAVLAEIGPEARASLLRDMSPEELAAAARGMDVDDVADLIDELPDTSARALFASMGLRDRERLRAVLSFPASSAGGLMDLDVVAVRPAVTVAVVLRFLRMRGSLPSNADSLFVVDGAGRFLGTVPFTRLVTARPAALIEALIERDSPRIDPYTGAGEVVRLFQDHDLLSAAVVGRGGRLLGRINADDIVDVIRQDGESAVRRIAGVPLQEDMFAGALTSSVRRTPWLGYGFAGAAVTSFVVSRFESTIGRFALLAALMPIVASMAGIAAMQTVTLTIRGLVQGRIVPENARSLLQRELTVAALNGLILGSLVAIAVALWLDHWWIGAATGAALLMTLLAAAFIGVLIPMTLDRLRVDPVFATGLITTSTDAIGYALLLGLATLVLL